MIVLGEYIFWWSGILPCEKVTNCRSWPNLASIRSKIVQLAKLDPLLQLIINFWWQSLPTLKFARHLSKVLTVYSAESKRLYCSFQELYNSKIFVQMCNFELWKVNTCSSRLLWGLGSADSCNPPPSDEIARNARNSRQKIFEQKNMDETALQTWLLVIGWAGFNPPPPLQQLCLC